MNDKTEAEYHSRFRKSTKNLMKSGKKDCRDLDPIDVIGCYFSAGVSLAQLNMPDFDIASMLHNIADDLNSRKVERTVN